MGESGQHLERPASHDPTLEPPCQQRPRLVTVGPGWVVPGCVGTQFTGHFMDWFRRAGSVLW